MLLSKDCPLQSQHILHYICEIYYRPPTKLLEGTVFSRICRGGSHVTVTHDVLDLTVLPPPTALSLAPLDMGPHYRGIPRPSPLDRGMTSGGHHWRPVWTCPLQDTPDTLVLTSGGYWSTYASASARYTPYWNAFLLLTIILNDIVKSQASFVVKPDISLSAYYLQMTEMSTDHVH